MMSASTNILQTAEIPSRKESCEEILNPLTHPNVRRECLPQFSMCRKCSNGNSAAVAIVVIVCGLMVWAFTLVPSVLFAKSVIKEGSNKMESASCQQLPYSRTSSPCYNVLNQFHRQQQTLSNINVTHIYVSQYNEAGIMVLNNLLQFDNECREVFVPFMCQYLFPVCNRHNGTSFCLSSQDCMYVSTEVCKEEWQEVATYGLGSILPNCATFPANSSCSSNLTGASEAESNASVSTNCDADFLFINGTCKPQCGRWATLQGRAIQITLLTFGGLSLSTLMGSLIFSITQWKTILVLPKLFIVLMNVDMSVISLMIVFNSFYPKVLVCLASDLYENPDSPSLYCSVSGATLLYALSQLSITWLVCNSIMLWIFKDPFTARSIQKTHCNKYVHLALLALCSVVPIIPVVIIFELDGFAAVGFPPLLCTPRNPDAAYFSTILPFSVASAVGSSILSYMLWVVYKHYAAVLEKTTSTRARPRMVQRRLVVIFCSSLIIGAFLLISLAKSSRGVKQLTMSLKNYFVCNESGRELEGLCEVFKKAAESTIDMNLVAFPYLCILIFPVVHLIYTIRKQDVVTCRKCYRLCTRLVQKTVATSQQLPAE